MNDLKNINQFVDDQFNLFLNDFNDSKKCIKLFINFDKSQLEHKSNELNINLVEKKFQPKIKSLIKKISNPNKNMF